MKKKKMRLKGKLRLYMNWPLIMTFLLVAMNIWVLMVDRKAAFIMFMFILIYLAIAGVLASSPIRQTSSAVFVSTINNGTILYSKSFTG